MLEQIAHGLASHDQATTQHAQVPRDLPMHPSFPKLDASPWASRNRASKVFGSSVQRLHRRLQESSVLEPIADAPTSSSQATILHAPEPSHLIYASQSSKLQGKRASKPPGIEPPKFSIADPKSTSWLPSFQESSLQGFPYVSRKDSHASGIEASWSGFEVS